MIFIPTLAPLKNRENNKKLENAQKHKESKTAY
jgi:hypothetical protein